MRHPFLALSIALGALTFAPAQVSIGIGTPNVSLGINLPVFPTLVPVPGYPVYYAPDVNGNYFFYDGMYWMFMNDNWYASSWYNGPWGLVAAESVPYFILRVPVRYYRRPPAFFRAAIDGSIERTQVQAPNQCPNGSRRMVFADELLYIHGSPT